jgi:glutamyl-Q tRNA(Asp) synthetase
MQKPATSQADTESESGYIGRFAPSPTGPLHFGSLLAALASFLDARANQGKWLMRIEDLDPPREPAGSAELILQQLQDFGMNWDDEVLYQSTRLGA